MMSDKVIHGYFSHAAPGIIGHTCAPCNTSHHESEGIKKCQENLVSDDEYGSINIFAQKRQTDGKSH